MKNLVSFIKKQGWEDFGIISYQDLILPLEIHKKIFQKWVDHGFSADMGYLKGMEKDRYHPENKLPDIKSVIVLTAWYGTPIEGPMEGPIEGVADRGIIARYARGKDYHKQLKKKLIELSDWLKEKYLMADPEINSALRGGELGFKRQLSNVETYVSVDSGPTADRVLAEAAGIGFFGKNSCIINPSKGSYFFIATLLTNLDLPSTQKRAMPNCGNCTRCAVACPTGALVGPGRLDARKCISYLTIENKGGIPPELRSKMGNRLFGCDICQEVCPFNKGRAHRQEVKIEKLKAEYGAGSTLDLREVLLIETDEQYLAKFAGTPLMRAKRRGLIRNACVVAGNSGNPELIPYLEKVIEREEDEMLKEHAKWGIGRLMLPNDQIQKIRAKGGSSESQIL